MIVINHFFPQQITTNFSSTEIYDASSYVDSQFVFDEQVVKIAQLLRDFLGSQIHINSAFRTEDYNALIGGVKNSQHIKAKALDLRGIGLVDMVSEFKYRNSLEYQALKDAGLRGLGLYDNFIHIDTRSANFAFWDNRNKGEIESSEGDSSLSLLTIITSSLIGLLFLKLI